MGQEARGCGVCFRGQAMRKATPQTKAATKPLPCTASATANVNSGSTTIPTRAPCVSDHPHRSACRKTHRPRTDRGPDDHRDRPGRGCFPEGGDRLVAGVTAGGGQRQRGQQERRDESVVVALSTASHCRTRSGIRRSRMIDSSGEKSTGTARHVIARTATTDSPNGRASPTATTRISESGSATASNRTGTVVACDLSDPRSSTASTNSSSARMTSASCSASFESKKTVVSSVMNQPTTAPITTMSRWPTDGESLQPLVAQRPQKDRTRHDQQDSGHRSSMLLVRSTVADVDRPRVFNPT